MREHETLREKIYKERLFFDGAMGTMLVSFGMGAGQIPDRMNLTEPETVQRVHEEFLRAGCDILTANTFGANPLKLPGEAAEVVKAAVEIATRAVEKVGGKRRYIACDIGPCGRLLSPLGDLPFEEAYASFCEAARAAQDAGADLLMIETMSDLYELKAAALACKESTSLPVFATVTVDESGRLLTGADVRAVAALLEGLGVDALGLNCSLRPDQIAPFAGEMLRYASIPVIVMPNAGLPGLLAGEAEAQSPDDYARAMADIARMGAHMLGGCCGTTPAHMAAVYKAAEAIPFVPPQPKAFTVVCSGSESVALDRPVIVGERINPTGKKRFKQALLDGDMDYILGEGIAQRECGAHILDVNVGLPGIDEKDMMARTVAALQAVLHAPLQIDSSDPVTLKAALRVYNGKAMVNSVNGKRESMEAVFPLIQKYGGVVVALTLDESGIPDTAEGRLAIARRIIDTAKEYGIDRKDILIDTLTLAASSGQKQAKVTLDALELVKSELGAGTILGVSNVSFGLPQREQLNAAFLAMALDRGLTAAIINPCAPAMAAAFRASCALGGADIGFSDYIGAYGGQDNRPPEKGAAQEQVSLAYCIEKGLSERAYAVAAAALSDTEPMALVEQELIPALDRVGKDFEAGRAFLPQLLKSAEASQRAFDAIKEAMTRGGRTQRDRGTVIVATVRGDIHDIGKNIAKTLLQNYGFRVVDLGRDVAPETIVAAAREHRARLVGLSALMTTTVGAMAETIRLIRAENLTDCRVMVAGAVVTEGYARSIGADKYVRDAMAGVAYAREVFAE